MTHRTRYAPLLCLLVSAVIVLGGCRQNMSAQQRQLELASFDKVHQTVLDRYFKPERLTTKPAGIGWTQTYNQLRPGLEQAKTVQQARGLTNQLVESIGESHFGIIPSHLSDTSTSSDDSQDSPNVASLGITPRLIDGQVIVFRVLPGSPAARANVTPGTRVDRINKVHLDRRIKELEKSQTIELYQQILIENLFEGDQGQPATLLLNYKGSTRTVNLSFEKSTVPTSKFGNLPPIPVEVEVAKLPNAVGYFRLSAFFDPPRVFGSWREFIQTNQDSNGIIIDLRGNPGGVGIMASGIANQLVDKPNLKLGTMSMRDGSLKFVLNPQQPRFNGPVAILIDQTSASTTEIFAGGLQDLGRARIFGSRSAGMALPSVIEKLPNGDSFQFATADYVSDSGKRLEGAGVTPDETVPLTRQLLEQARDPVIEAARKWISTQSSAK